MLYNVTKQQEMLDALITRASSIIDMCITLVKEGYQPNKNKYNKLNWTSLMISAVKDINMIHLKLRVNVESLFNQVMAL